MPGAAQTLRLLALAVAAVLSVMAGIASAGTGSSGQTGRAVRNPPWFPSVMASENYDSARTKLFAQADFTGSFVGKNVVRARFSR